MSTPELGHVLKKEDDRPKGQGWHLVPGFLNPDTAPFPFVLINYRDLPEFQGSLPPKR